MSVSRSSVFIVLFFFINLSESKCPKSFSCGHLGVLEFPFTSMLQPECGLFLLDCTFQAKIQLKAEGYWYSIYTANVSQNTLLVSDDLLYRYLLDNNSCLVSQRRYIPRLPFTSVRIISPFLNVFSCNNNSSNREQIRDHFRDFNSSAGCAGATLYYSIQDKNSIIDPTYIPESCSLIHLPGKPNPEGGGLLSQVTSDFEIKWNVSRDCLSCHSKGEKCVSKDDDDQIHCQVKSRRTTIMLALSAGSFAAFVSTLMLFFFLIRRKAKPETQNDIELFLRSNGNLGPKRFKYSHLKKMTRSFKESLGKGGYGSVYKGKLPDGRLVAVKLLNESKGNGEDFINEVSSISRTSHINIVTLVGFCFEGSKRALVYEFMPNGSLDKFIQNPVEPQKLFEIAVGIARGLEYLHRGCSMRILHFDIKPHNILLDKDFNPKISDFGLAKLCPNRSSIVSMLNARGTIGYIAPEVFCRNFGGVSHKSDVYSYGMMILEIGGGKKNIDPGEVDRSSEVYFPQYIYRQLEMDDEHGISNEDDVKKKLIIVGLWCIQTDPKNRPSMSRVVEMLEGKLDILQVPPRPYMSSPERLGQHISISESM